MYILKLGNSEAWVSSWGYTLLKDSAETYKSLNQAIRAKKKWMKERGQVYVDRAVRAGRTFDLNIEELKGKNE